MAIAIQCEHCGKQMRVKDSLSGTRGLCPFCQGELEIPQVTVAVRIVETDSKSITLPSGLRDDNPVALADQQLDQQIDATQKSRTTLIACPDCDREISRLAVTCPNCGRPMLAQPVNSPSVYSQAVSVTTDNSIVTTQRRGGKYEAVGFLLILLGMGLFAVGAVSESSVGFGIGVVTGFIGLCVFIVGRFM